ncbi:MAG: hypothetical protein ABI718_17500 [Acidobacteriota bacterium]
MTSLATAVIIIVAVALALLLAFLPLKVLMDMIARNITEPIQRFIERQRDRRSVARETPDRRSNS